MFICQPILRFLAGFKPALLEEDNMSPDHKNRAATADVDATIEVKMPPRTPMEPGAEEGLRLRQGLKSLHMRTAIRTGFAVPLRTVEV